MSAGRALARSFFGAGGLALAARLIVGGAFLALAVLKLRDPVGFLKTLREYDLAPAFLPHLLNYCAALLPWVEVLCGALLVLGIAVRGNALLFAALLVFFSAALVSRALDLQQDLPFCAIKFDCGCGQGVVNVCRKLAENAVLLLLSLLVLFDRAQRFCLRPRLVGARAATTGR
ncbi:MAG: DoxX family membrane protein [Planctomycetes bacterium]|nr:DoxX family membrane protein [Planctomycetota bacterium]